MNLTKNQIYIISSVIIIAVIYFMFFRKKTTSNGAAKMATPPPANTQTDPNPGESGYYGSQFGWNAGTNPLYTSFNQAMGSVDGNMSNSVAGIMESNYNAAGAGIVSRANILNQTGGAYVSNYANRANRVDIASNYAANAVNESNYMPWQAPMPGTSNPSKFWETN